MVFFPMEQDDFAIECYWWNDQVFEDEGDPFPRFAELVRYFISLQELFHAPHLFLSPEITDHPGEEEIHWVEV